MIDSWIEFCSHELEAGVSVGAACYIGNMEELYRGYIGIMENKMETTT